MTVKDIITAYLREHGYDGLCDVEECGCGVGISPCDYPLGCQPAYRWECKGCPLRHPEHGCPTASIAYVGGCYRPEKPRETGT